jgi:hypothetical protein
MVGWFRPGKAWLYYTATGHRVVVTPRSPVLWLPDLETATQTLTALKKEINRRLTSDLSALEVSLGGRPFTELTPEFVAAILPHFGVLPAAEFGDFTDQVLIEGDIDAARALSGQNLVHLADKLFELVKRVQDREAARPEPDAGRLPNLSPALQQLADTVTCKPSWNKEKGELHFGDQVVKRFANLSTATNQFKVLDSFQEEGWPDKIFDPLDAGKLHETLRQLNKRLTRIRFIADGSAGGIRWTVL